VYWVQIFDLPTSNVVYSGVIEQINSYVYWPQRIKFGKRDSKVMFIFGWYIKFPLLVLGICVSIGSIWLFWDYDFVVMIYATYWPWWITWLRTGRFLDIVLVILMCCLEVYVCGVAADIVRATKPADTSGPPWQDDKFFIGTRTFPQSLSYFADLPLNLKCVSLLVFILVMKCGYWMDWYEISGYEVTTWLEKRKKIMWCLVFIFACPWQRVTFPPTLPLIGYNW